MNTLDSQQRANFVTSNGPWQYIIVFGVLTLGIALGAMLGRSSTEPKAAASSAVSLPVPIPAPSVASSSPTGTPSATAPSVTPATTTTASSKTVPLASAHSDKSDLYKVRQAFEQNGWDVSWDDPKQEVVCRSKTGSIATINLETHKATLDGKSMGAIKGLVVRNGQLYGLSEFLEKATEGSFHPAVQRGR